MLDANLFDHLITDITGDTLYIGLESDYSYENTIEKASITLPDLHSLKLSGASPADVSGFVSTNPLQVEVSGSSCLFFPEVEVGDTQLNISGTSNAEINVTDSRDANLGGLSNLGYFGKPTLGTIVVSDSSAVHQGVK